MLPVTDSGSCFYMKRGKMPLMERCIHCQTVGSRLLAAWMDFLWDVSDGSVPQRILDICSEADLGGVHLDLRGDWVQRLVP